MCKNSLLLLSATAFMLLSMSVSGAGMVYKCKNAQGKLLYQKTPCTEEKQVVSSWTPNTKVKLPTQEPKKKNTQPLVIKQGQGGHYFLNAEVNSHGLIFVIDTGATMVSLPRAFAATASLFCNDKAVIETANGQSKVCTTTITELKVGDFVLSNVTALIVPNLGQPLLGMNVLQFFNIEQKNDEMRLSEQDAKAP
jgi:clan AA aspartic protease (TIGR02281 family)